MTGLLLLAGGSWGAWAEELGYGRSGLEGLKSRITDL